MADLERKMRLSMETGAAQDAVGKLADTMAGLAKASDDGGDAMKRAARETAEATAAMNAAREAAQKEQRALNEATAAATAHGKESAEAAAALARLKAAQEASAKAAKEADAALARAATTVNDLAQTADRKSQPALKRMANELAKVGKEADRNASDLRTLEHRITALGGAADKSGGLLALLKKGLAFGAGAAAAAGGIGLVTDAIKGAATFAVETGAEFERLRTALETTTGSSTAAAAAFAQIQKFAASTPYSLQEVTDGFIKLSNRGLDPSEKALTAYGDTASAMGKSLDDMIEAVADATTGEFERLKEFGIRASKNGDRVAFTFRGMTKEVGFSAQEIERYLINLGRNNFAGGMEKQSQTLAGLWSTLKDTAAQFADTVMQSGVSDVLKDIMREMTAGAGGANELAKSLGGALAEGLRATVTLAKGAVAVLGAFARAINFVTDTVDSMNEPLQAAALRAGNLGREHEVAEARLVAYAKANGGALGPLGALMSQTMLSTSAQERLNAAIREGQRAREDEARQAAVLAGLKERSDRTEAARLADLEKRKANAERAGLMAEYNELKGDGSLTPSQRKRKLELEKALDIEKKAKGKKGPSRAWTREASLGAAERFEERERAEREGAFAAQVAAFEQESDLREQKITGIEREIEAIEARGIAETEQVDLIFYTLDIEDEAAARREALIDQRIAAEERLARWQVKNAKNAAQREKAQTRLEAAEHTKRLRGLEKIQREEEKEHKRKEQAVTAVVSAVTQLGEGLVGAFERMAAGEKGAMAEMIKNLLAGVARKNAVLALEQGAMAIAAAATTWGIPNPKAIAHGTAAALHAGVALAAGAGALVAGRVADSRQGGGGGGDSGFRANGGRPTRPSDTGGSGSSGREMEQMEVPVSYEDTRRRDAGIGPRMGPAPVTVIINGPVLGEGGSKKLAQDIERVQYNHRGAGKRL